MMHDQYPTRCPRCVAQEALALVIKAREWRPAPDVSALAHAVGIAEGYLRVLVEYRLELCAEHRDTPAARKTRQPPANRGR